MSTSRILRLVTGIMEAVLGIPILGGIIVIGMLWTPLGIMFILHVITLIFCSKENKDKAGSILGIITSCIAWIPFLGMALHIVTAIILLISAAKTESDPFDVTKGA